MGLKSVTPVRMNKFSELESVGLAGTAMKRCCALWLTFSAMLCRRLYSLCYLNVCVCLGSETLSFQEETGFVALGAQGKGGGPQCHRICKMSEGLYFLKTGLSLARYRSCCGCLWNTLNLHLVLFDSGSSFYIYSVKTGVETCTFLGHFHFAFVATTGSVSVEQHIGYLCLVTTVCSELIGKLWFRHCALR